MIARRMLALVAVLMFLTVIATSLAPPPPTPTVRSQGSVEASGPLSEIPPPATLPLTVDADRGKAQSVAANSGELIHLTVHSKTLDVVELVGLDLMKAVSPETPAEFDIMAPAEPADYPIVLTQSGRTAGTLRITGPE